MTQYDAVIVGAGPNGLTAAARLATEGWSVCVLEASSTIGGGCRTAELDVPGVRHDICAAAHPLGIASPAFRSLGLERHGVTWRHSPVACAHPFDDGDAALLYRDLARTSGQFTTHTWRRLFGPLIKRWDDVVDTLLHPLIDIPSHPLLLPRLWPAALPADLLGKVLRDPKAAALLVGIAAHSMVPLRQPLTAGVGVFLAGAGQVGGWPVAEGGSQQIMDALARIITSNGGVIETGRPVRSRADLPSARVTMLDTNPGQVAAITGYGGRKFRRFRHGLGSCKVDYVLKGAMPWINPNVARAATVHLGGTAADIVESHHRVNQGVADDQPFVLVTQPAAADPTRVTAGGQPLWAYCHVPSGSDHDVSGTIEAQFDRFAPGWRDLVVAKRVTTAKALSEYNINYVGGDIAGGSLAGLRAVMRPAVGTHPYRLPVEGFWLCSASTPPGPGVHGMGGWNAVSDVLAHSRRSSGQP